MTEERVADAIAAAMGEGEHARSPGMLRVARAALNAMTEGSPIWAEENGGVRGFMDKVDFECELGGASGGNVIYPSEEDCAERCSSHIDSCGMVEVEVRLVRVVRPSHHDDEELLASLSPTKD